MGIFTSVTFTLAAFTLLIQSFSLNAINMESAKESKCFEIKKTVHVEKDWMDSHKIFYYPLMSRYDLYNAGVEFSGKNATDLHENQLYYDSCITFKLDEDKMVGRGFNGPDKVYSVKLVKGFEIYKFTVEGDEDAATCYVTLTDNKTFSVSACCISGIDQMTWGVASTEKRLPEETEKQIYDHVESLGFKREYFTAFRYDTCGI